MPPIVLMLWFGQTLFCGNALILAHVCWFGAQCRGLEGLTACAFLDCLRAGSGLRWLGLES